MNKFFLALVLFMFFLSSCSLKKVSKSNVSTLPKNTKELIERVNTIDKIPDQLSLRGKINLIQEEQELSLNINIKFRKDSIIWASLSAPLGIEIFRVQISKDSIYFINRANKTYFIKPISYISNYLKTETSFSEISQIITASLRINKDSYSFEADSNSYIIKSEKKQYKIDRNKFYILEANILENNKSNLSVAFSEFKEISTYFFPHHHSVKVQSAEKFSVIIKYSRVLFNQKQKSVFKIPNHYVEIK